MQNTHTLQTFSVHAEMDSLRPLQLVTQLYVYPELQQTTIRTIDKYCVCGVCVCVCVCVSYQKERKQNSLQEVTIKRANAQVALKKVNCRH